MGTKLEQLIANIAVQAGDVDDGCSTIPAELVAAAAKAAPLLTPEDTAKLPDLWYPAMSAKKAGAPKLNEGWGRIWFESLVEVLYQAGPIGLPALFELWERETKTYHGFVLVRLLRHAANGVKKKEILAKVKSRLPEIGSLGGPQCVEETLLWASRGEPRLTKMLRPMKQLKLKGIGVETVDSVMKEWAESRGVRL